jgi:hypothetical protein
MEMGSMESARDKVENDMIAALTRIVQDRVQV